MDVHDPLTVFEEEGVDSVLDRLEAARVGTIVLGDLLFDGSPAYPAKLHLYQMCETTPPVMRPELPTPGGGPAESGSCRHGAGLHP